MSILEKVKKSKKASRQLLQLSAEQRKNALEILAQKLHDQSSKILEANQIDLQNAHQLEQSLFERLTLTPEKIDTLVQGIQKLSKDEDLILKPLQKTLIDENLVLTQQIIPLGLIAMVFESRPDAIPQIASIAIRTGNALILKGGKEAQESNRAIIRVLQEASEESGLPESWFLHLETREEFQELLSLHHWIDLIIPRGSSELMHSIQKNTLIPVLGHAAGICHLYIAESAEQDLALEVTLDSKLSYPAACNSLETILVHSKIAENFLKKLSERAKTASLKLLGCSESQKILKIPSPIRWDYEYGTKTLAIKIVSSPEEAIAHIIEYGSAHTDGICTKNPEEMHLFKTELPSATVMVNCSTRFADGYRMGLGAEIGVSTSKLHARGPVGPKGLLTYQYFLEGNGQTVSDYSGKNPKRKYLHKKIL